MMRDVVIALCALGLVWCVVAFVRNRRVRIFRLGLLSEEFVWRELKLSGEQQIRTEYLRQHSMPSYNKMFFMFWKSLESFSISSCEECYRELIS